MYNRIKYYNVIRYVLWNSNNNYYNDLQRSIIIY